MRLNFRVGLLFSFLFLILLSGCSVSADQIDLEVSLSPSSLVFRPDSGYKGELLVDYTLTNNSGYPLDPASYELSFGIARPEEDSVILLSTQPLDVAVGATLSDSYTHTFDYIVGDDGEQEIRVEVYKSLTADSFDLIKSVAVPLLFIYE